MKLSDGVQQIVNYANEGIIFLFGGLVNNESIGMVFAIKRINDYYFLLIFNFCSLLLRDYANRH